MQKLSIGPIEAPRFVALLVVLEIGLLVGFRHIFRTVHGG